MVKAADALHEAGYAVRVVATSSLPGHAQMDDALVRSRVWKVTTLRYGRADAWASAATTALSQRAADRAVRLVGAAHAPLGLVAQAFGRMHRRLRAAAMAEPADLYYGGTAGALAATARAARARSVPYALDLEDFHSAEHEDGPEARRAHAQIARIERDLLPGAAFVSAAGEAMAEAYQGAYGRRPITVDNVFPLPAEEPDLTPTPGTGLRLYWFSQTIGPGRGLEDAVHAAGMSGLPIELHLRGSEVSGYVKQLRVLAQRVAPQLVIMQHPPEPPDALIAVSGRERYDVGLSLEQVRPRSRALCLSNKAFTYLAAGIAIAFTETPGQRALAEDLGEAAFVAQPGDVAALAVGLTRFANDKALLARAKRTAWQAAVDRWRWDHPRQKGALLAAVEQALKTR
jgi:hypothetical protein